MMQHFEPEMNQIFKCIMSRSLHKQISNFYQLDAADKFLVTWLLSSIKGGSILGYKHFINIERKVFVLYIKNKKN